MNNEVYTNIGILVVWCIKYIYIPIGVGVLIRLISRKLFQPQPGRQRKKRSLKTVYN